MLDELANARTLPIGALLIGAVGQAVRTRVLAIIGAVIGGATFTPRVASILAISAFRLAILALAFRPLLLVGLRRVIAILLSAKLGVGLAGISTIRSGIRSAIRSGVRPAILAGSVVELRAAILPVSALRPGPLLILIGTRVLRLAGILRLAIKSVGARLTIAILGKIVALAIHVVAGATIILPGKTLRAIAALRLTAILLLFLRGRDDPVIMLGVLKVIFRYDPVTGGGRVAGQLQIFFMNLESAAPNANIRAIRIEGLHAERHIGPASAPVIIVVVATAIIIVTPARPFWVWTLSHPAYLMKFAGYGGPVSENAATYRKPRADRAMVISGLKSRPF